MRTTKKKSRKRTGIKVQAAAALLLLMPISAVARKKAPTEDYALISGTVFQSSGYALPDADVRLVAETSPGEKPKAKKMEATSSPRGEFAFRVPPGPGKYTVTVAAKGYQSSQKSVTVQGLEREEVTFQLDRESK